MNFNWLIIVLLTFLTFNSMAYPIHPKAPNHIIGSYAHGKILNATPIAKNGKGYEVIRRYRNRYYGHPELIKFIEDLGKQSAKKKLGVITVGDMSMKNGGRMPSGHRSHQIGLDVDIIFEAKDKKRPISVLTPNKRRIDKRKWDPNFGEMIKLAALNDNVERIFVNRVIKASMCRAYPKEMWLRKLRPWAGHDDHYHVRLKCPKGSKQCVGQYPPPPGRGC